MRGSAKGPVAVAEDCDETPDDLPSSGVRRLLVDTHALLWWLSDEPRPVGVAQTREVGHLGARLLVVLELRDVLRRPQ
jgi:hypothetical protein